MGEVRDDDQAISFSHTGDSYLLGYGSDFFGIWDRDQPEGPVERFPRTDEGWAQAWWRYIAIEPRYAEVRAQAGVPTQASGAPIPSPSVEDQRPGRSGWRSAAAWTGTIFGFVLLVLPGFLALRSLRRWQRGEIRRPLLPWSLSIVCLAVMGSCEGSFAFVIQQCVVDHPFDLQANACHEADGNDLDPTYVGSPSSGDITFGHSLDPGGPLPVKDLPAESLRYEGGNYQVVSRRPNRGAWGAVEVPEGPFEGMLVVAEAVVVGPPAAVGVLCFGSDSDEFYAFVFAPATRYYAIMAFEGDRGHVLAERRLYPEFSISNFGSFELQGDCFVNPDGSSTARLSLSGFTVLEYVDRTARYPSFRGGGVIVGGPGPRAEAEFSRVVISHR
jgi:hypothetical protein